MTARERMLQLSVLLTGSTAREHFLSISNSGGVIVYNGLYVRLRGVSQ